MINQIKITQQELSSITQNSQHSQYQIKPPYYSMQATCLPQFNNPPQREREREKVPYLFHQQGLRSYIFPTVLLQLALLYMSPLTCKK